MRWMERLERSLSQWAVPHLGLWLVAGQVLLYLALTSGQIQPEDIVLIPERVRAGEVHRLLTFLIQPPMINPIFLFFALYLFLLMANALEARWGVFRFNGFLLTGYLATVGTSFFFPLQPVTNTFLGGSVFLAFAFLHPDFELRLFFVIPVKIKWLAAVAWVGYGLALVTGPTSIRLLMLASLLNFFLFFGREILSLALNRKRNFSLRCTAEKAEVEPFHRCAVCNRTDLSDPQLNFIYLPTPDGTRCVCREHTTAFDK